MGRAASPPEHRGQGAAAHPLGGALRGLGRRPPPAAAGLCGPALRSLAGLLRVSLELPVVSGVASWGPKAALSDQGPCLRALPSLQWGLGKSCHWTGWARGGQAPDGLGSSPPCRPRLLEWGSHPAFPAYSLGKSYRQNVRADGKGSGQTGACRSLWGACRRPSPLDSWCPLAGGTEDRVQPSLRYSLVSWQHLMSYLFVCLVWSEMTGDLRSRWTEGAVSPNAPGSPGVWPPSLLVPGAQKPGTGHRLRELGEGEPLLASVPEGLVVPHTLSCTP